MRIAILGSGAVGGYYGAKLARADGEVHAAEYATFSTVFQADNGSERNIRRLYQLARQTTRGSVRGPAHRR